MKRLFDIAVHVIIKEESNTFGMIGQYEHFLKELRTVYNYFVETTQRECEEKVFNDFKSFIKIIDWNLMSGMNEFKE
jgi:hypothetical protein